MKIKAKAHRRACNPGRPAPFMILAAALGVAVPCGAQYNPFAPASVETATRAGHSEFYLLGQYWHADTITMPNVTLPTAPGPNPPLATSDLSFKFHDAGAWGLGGTYYLNNYFGLNAEFNFGYPGYTASFNGQQLTGTAFMQSGKFRLVYDVLAGPVTPFVSGGLGYLYLDSGIPSGPPEYYGWWDEFWGYTVVGNTPTYANTYFTLNAAAGLNWDVTDRFFLRLSCGADWMDVGRGAGWVPALQGTLALGFKY